MLRGVNVGGHHLIKMEVLRAIFQSLKLSDLQTLGVSGNVIFRTSERNLSRLVQQIQQGIERTCGFRPEVIVRTCSELRDVVARNPFATRRGIVPGKLAVTFLAADPGEEARASVRRMKFDPEEVRVERRELYIYFPNGMGRPNLSWAALDRALKTPYTSRNWNTVTKMLAIAEKLESGTRL